MTIDNENYKNVYSGNGSVTDFAFTFQIAAETEVLVTVDDSDLTYSTDYTVTLNDDGTGTVSCTTAPASGTSNVVLRLNSTFTQEVDLEETGAFSSGTLEEIADKLTRLIKQVKEITSRAIVQNPNQTTEIEFPSPSSNLLIGWNEDADGLENKTPMDVDAQTAAELAADEAEAAQIAAEAAQAAAEAAAASVDLPVIGAGDAGKALIVNAGETSIEFGGIPVNTTGTQTISGTKSFVDLVNFLGNISITGTTYLGTLPRTSSDLTPSDDKDLVSKKYVDDELAAAFVTPAIGTFSTTSTGALSVTGVGFEPSIVIVGVADAAYADAKSGFGLSFYNGSSSYGIATSWAQGDSSGTSWITTGITAYRNSASYFSATFTSLDSDGFTINIGTAASDGTGFYIAIK